MSSRAQIMSLETIIALVFTVLIAGVMIGFVVMQTDPRGHFQEFYVKDLSLLSEVVVASPGELILTYDNFKRRLGLEYTFEEGLVSVSLIDEEFTILGEQKRAYGTHDNFLKQTQSFREPSFVTFIKTGDELVVSESVGYLRGCQLRENVKETTNFAIGEVNPHEQEAFRVNQEQLLTGFQDSMRVLEREVPVINLESVDTHSLVITLRYREDAQDKISIQHGSRPQDEYLGCVLARQLEGVSIGGMEVEQADIQRINVAITIYGPSKRLDERLLGQIIGRTVAIYERR